MSSAKQVVLVFLPSDSGVDGARSLYETSGPSGPLQWVNNGIRSLIKQTQFAIPPLSLMILSSIEVPGVQQTICDLRFEPFAFETPWALAGISVQTGMAKKAFELADLLRSRNIPVVLGGPHVTLFAESCRPHADILVHGEADDLWKTVLEDLAAGTLRADYRSTTPPDMEVSRPVYRHSLLKTAVFHDQSRSDRKRLPLPVRFLQCSRSQRSHPPASQDRRHR